MKLPLINFESRQHFWTGCLSILFVSPQRAAGVLSRTLSSSQTIVEEALTAGVVKKMIKFLRVKLWHYSQLLNYLEITCTT